jgi:integrase
MGDLKEAWEAAKKRAGVVLNPNVEKPEALHCRFHDLRHTGSCTRMLEAGVPFSVVAVIMGWSPGTAVRMARRYGHIGHAARREAIDKLSRATIFDSEGAPKWAQSQAARVERTQ